MAKAKKKTKADELQEAVAEAVGAGRELHLESVDFSDPNRPKTCLEVDFPILPINHVAASRCPFCETGFALNWLNLVIQRDE